MSEFTLRQLQDEQMPWVERNFGKRPSWMPLMGICEELGELVEANDKHGPGVKFRDAIADAIIFAADYCTAMGWDLQALWDAREDVELDTPERTRKMLVCIARMQHHHLKAEQGIRGGREHHEAEAKRYLSRLLFQLDWVALTPVLPLVQRTWAKVSKRDWTKQREATP